MQIVQLAHRALRRITGAALAVGLISVVSPALAGAATFNVSRFDDPAPGSCTPGNCSLREAVLAANASPGADTILAPAGVYTLKQVGQDLAIADTLTLKGVGGQAMVDANGPFTGDRAFEILSGTNATFSFVSVRNGIGPKDADGQDRGGAIRVDQGATLSMSSGVVRGSNVPDTGSQGGGIYTAGRLQLTRVKVEDNKTGFAFGGGLYASATGYATVVESVIANNNSSFGGGISGNGGAQFTRSLLRDNSAGLGGAVYANGCGSFKFNYTTIANNNSSGSAGAIRVRDANVFLTNATVSGNHADGNGGGVAIQSDPSGCPTQLYIGNTILAGNSASGGSSPDCQDQTGGNVTSFGHNVIGDATGCTFSGSGDQLGSAGSPLDPRLGPLAMNGGLTATMALQSGSPAIGQGKPASCGTTDQRGVVIGHDGDPGCDVGAYELVFAPHNTSAPKISGKHGIGHKVHCSSGTWSGATPMTFAYRWLRNGSPIPNATKSAHKIATADLGHKLRCTVTATNAAGQDSATSAGVKIGH